MQKRLSFESIVVALVQFIMLGLVFVGVLSRYLLHFSISFTEELVCAMFVLLSTMGGALASKDNSHFTLDLITGMMKPTMQKRFLIFSTCLDLWLICTNRFIFYFVSQYRSNNSYD